MESYEKLLAKARTKLPEKSKTSERFEIPAVKGHIQGSKTIVSNFIQICDTFRREPSHLLKYLLRELASPGYIEDTRLVLGRKISSNLINVKVQRYAEDFVLCKECKKPDTTLFKEERILMIKCSACGAKHTVKTKI
ncbi:MAG TPA: translation initiation factor IF-2 subunit beta [Candidatus Nanoarchaeia archaeon]|nr:translation initiation factor IF-2 subunit beta [Candidatus Nanoarchaeia archaeon]